MIASSSLSDLLQYGEVPRGNETERERLPGLFAWILGIYDEPELLILPC